MGVSKVEGRGEIKKKYADNGFHTKPCVSLCLSTHETDAHAPVTRELTKTGVPKEKKNKRNRNSHSPSIHVSKKKNMQENLPASASTTVLSIRKQPQGCLGG